MLATVYLNDQLLLETNEIEDEALKRDLPPELRSIDPAAL
jgi:hypothetical protein